MGKSWVNCTPLDMHVLLLLLLLLLEESLVGRYDVSPPRNYKWWHFWHHNRSVQKIICGGGPRTLGASWSSVMWLLAQGLRQGYQAKI